MVSSSREARDSGRQAAYFIGKKGPAALVLSEKLVVGMLVTYVLKISIGTFFAT